MSEVRKDDGKNWLQSQLDKILPADLDADVAHVEDFKGPGGREAISRRLGSTSFKANFLGVDQVGAPSGPVITDHADFTPVDAPAPPAAGPGPVGPAA